MTKETKNPLRIIFVTFHESMLNYDITNGCNLCMKSKIAIVKDLCKLYNSEIFRNDSRHSVRLH